MDVLETDAAMERELGWTSSDSRRAPAGALATRVWLVDDDDQVRGLVAEVLNTQPGILCEREFGSARLALEALSTEAPPEVILLDINLGAENGLDALQPLKRRSPTTHVLMLTTFYDSVKEAQAFEAGASGFLLKSYEPGEIVRAIQLALVEGSDPGNRHQHTQTRVCATGLTPAPRSGCRRKPFNFVRSLFGFLAM